MYIEAVVGFTILSRATSNLKYILKIDFFNKINNVIASPLRLLKK